MKNDSQLLNFTLKFAYTHGMKEFLKRFVRASGNAKFFLERHVLWPRSGSVVVERSPGKREVGG